MRRRSEQRIFFPWEKRGGLVRRLGLQRARPFVWATLAVAFLLVVGAREQRSTGIRKTRVVLRDVRQALDRYLADHEGRCPTAFSQLSRYAEIGDFPLDAWGNPLRLTCPHPRRDLPYLLSSDGPDGIVGGLDRIDW